MRLKSPLYLAENSKNCIHIKNSYIYIIFLIKNQGRAAALPCPKGSSAPDTKLQIFSRALLPMSSLADLLDGGKPSGFFHWAKWGTGLQEDEYGTPGGILSETTTTLGLIKCIGRPAIERCNMTSNTF
jgi:hypothetical protein